MADREPELDELRALGRRAGLGPDHPGEPLDDPPADLWSRIEADASPAPAAPGSSARRRRWVPIAAAAAAAVVAAVAVGVVVVGSDEPDVVATATLEPLGPSGSGTATLLDEGGELRLRVEATDLDPGDGFLEVWVIDTGVERLVSLGPLRPDGLYDLPPGLDPEAFPVVDVSVEPIDGDPTHSGDSVLRGQLEF
jgi:anti-sigma-K factor RskA